LGQFAALTLAPHKCQTCHKNFLVDEDPIVLGGCGHRFHWTCAGYLEGCCRLCGIVIPKTVEVAAAAPALASSSSSSSSSSAVASAIITTTTTTAAAGNGAATYAIAVKPDVDASSGSSSSS
jgi:hypothetical protein